MFIIYFETPTTFFPARGILRRTIIGVIVRWVRMNDSINVEYFWKGQNFSERVIILNSNIFWGLSQIILFRQHVNRYFLDLNQRPTFLPQSIKIYSILQLWDKPSSCIVGAWKPQYICFQLSTRSRAGIKSLSKKWALTCT